MIIALAGNPNSGKTTMFNALTGKNEQVGNWAGVTVDKKSGTIKRSLSKGYENLIAVDLPGAYSMSPYTSEESVTSEYVKGENPDVIINIVDATNLSRSLFFTTQLLELGIPVVVALNKSDINEKKHTKINAMALSEALGCDVVETVSTSAKHVGLKALIAAAVRAAGGLQEAPYHDAEHDIVDQESAEAADRARFAFVNEIVDKVESKASSTHTFTIDDCIDRVITNRWFGIPIFSIVMFLIFQISQAWVGPYLADILSGWLSLFQEWIASLLVGTSDIVYALLIDGVIGGMIAVVGFLPLVMVMYFLMALLEDLGYMARVSVVLDPIFKKVGLSGKSVIPFVIGTGCSIPGVMACRTIRDERERRATAMLAPFMPCGAKLPVIGLFSGVFFEKAAWVGTLMYFAGILIIFFGALLINQITGHRAKKSYFIIELPDYKVPSFKRAFFSMCSRGWAFIVKAATIILVCNTVIQVMQSFTWSLQVVEEGQAATSILASVATPFAYVLVPIIGIHAWQLAAAAITGFIAKENVVGTLSVAFGISNLINSDELVLVDGAAVEVAAVFGLTKAAALAYLMFNLFTPPCFAAIGAMHAEIRSAKWFWGGIGLQFIVGFTISFFVYQIGTLLTTGLLGEGFVFGLLAVIIFAAILVSIIVKANRSDSVK